MKKSISLMILIGIAVCSALSSCSQNKQESQLIKQTQSLDSLDLNFFTNWEFHYRTQNVFAWYYEGANKYTCDLGELDGKELIMISNPKAFVKENNLHLNVESITSWLKAERFSDRIVFTKSNHQAGTRDTIGLVRSNEPSFTNLNNLFNQLQKNKRMLARMQITDVYFQDNDKEYLVFNTYDKKYKFIHKVSKTATATKTDVDKDWIMLNTEWWYTENLNKAGAQN